jgi:hypothetical protein
MQHARTTTFVMGEALQSIPESDLTMMVLFEDKNIFRATITRNEGDLVNRYLVRLQQYLLTGQGLFTWTRPKYQAAADVLIATMTRRGAEKVAQDLLDTFARV